MIPKALKRLDAARRECPKGEGDHLAQIDSPPNRHYSFRLDCTRYGSVGPPERSAFVRKIVTYGNFNGSLVLHGGQHVPRLRRL